MTTKAPKWRDDPEDMPIEWREKYPRVMRWEDVPEDRRVTPEFVLFYRGDFGKDEAARLAERRCEMAIDYGSRWGKRFGVYARCGNPPLPGETLCSRHGGPKKVKQPCKGRVPRPFTKWMPISAPPESGVHVLLLCEVESTHKQYVCVGYFAKNNTIVVALDGDIEAVYSEEADEFYLKEGCYEVIQNWGDYCSIAICDSVTHWQPLPKTLACVHEGGVTP